MPKKFLPYGHQSVSEEDIQAVVDVLRGDWLSMGPAVERFEKCFADYVGASEAVAFSSGTAALHGAVHAAGVRAGDCAIVPPMTFAATSNAVIYCGGSPLFCDIAPETLCLDPEEAGKACQAAQKPVKALLPVSFAGYPADIGHFKELARRYGTLVIEDASHALGAERGGRRAGRDADMTTFSFHPVKHITTAEGGMVVTDSPELARSLRLFRSHGIVKNPADFVRPYQGPWDNDMIGIGYNYRLSDVACALGESQMKRLDGFIARRKEIAARYRAKLQGCGPVTLPPEHPGHSYHLFPIWVEPARRKRVFEALRAEGIGVQVHYLSVHLHTYYRENYGHFEGEFPHAERFAAGEISLPIFPDMTDGDADHVIEALRSAVGEED